MTREAWKVERILLGCFDVFHEGTPWGTPDSTAHRARAGCYTYTLLPIYAASGGGRQDDGDGGAVVGLALDAE